ncbi:hypothetical protein M378DRAFT_18569 [Amanita muscaria Koide BX008]|uniref:Uncharacterized protein n=1 Tax=Amanita muscaria (strain Koide BX008) TaxID=946122 RepID=A0A0C2WDT6_AMAMK|nr:hypothetical protein M378DRAFT_18569 [Amanita muscaria Koide BX008]
MSPPLPTKEELEALSSGWYLGTETIPNHFKFSYSRELNGSFLASDRAIDEPIELWGIFKISKDSFTFTPTVGYDMSNKPAYDTHKNDDACWLNLRPAVNLLAHDHETVLGGSAPEWDKYVANLKAIEKRYKPPPKSIASSSAPKQQSALLDDSVLKLSHKFLLEKPEKLETASSSNDSETGKGTSEPASEIFVHPELTLENWPVPDSWNIARETLLARNYAIQPLNAYVRGKEKLIRPSRYEQKLKGAVAHVAFTIMAYRFAQENRVRFVAVAQRITVLFPPARASSNLKRKAQALETTSGSPHKKTKTDNEV